MRSVGNMTSRMTERKAKSADERPVLTEMKINRRSILSVSANPVRPMARSVHKEIVMVISTAVATPLSALATLVSRGPETAERLV